VGKQHARRKGCFRRKLERAKAKQKRAEHMVNGAKIKILKEGAEVRGGREIQSLRNKGEPNSCTTFAHFGECIPNAVHLHSYNSFL